MDASPPRLWTLALAYAALWSIAIVSGIVVAIAALFIEVDQPGALLTDPDRVAAFAEGLAAKPWALLFSVTVMAIGGAGIALAAGGLSPLPWSQRMRTVSISGPTMRGVAVYAAAVLAVIGVSEAESSLVMPFVPDELTSLEQMSMAIRTASTPIWWALLIAVGVAAPLAEELFFRGYLQTRLVERMGRWPGILVTAALFGLLHLDPVHTPLAFGIGLMLGWTTEQTGSVRPAIVAHIANNLLFIVTTRLLDWQPNLMEALSSVAIASAVSVAGVVWLRRLMRPAISPPSAEVILP